jgi:hypothetical protein
LSILALNIPEMDIDGDGLGDLDGSNINFVGLSLGRYGGVPFLAVEPTVSNGVLSMCPVAVLPTCCPGPRPFGPIIRAGLRCWRGTLLAGILPVPADRADGD